MGDKIEVTEEANKEWPTYLKTTRDAAFEQADEFLYMGQSPIEAASIVANTFIIAAWEVAAAGRIADGGTPDPNKFRAAVERVLENFDFSHYGEEDED